MMNPHQKYCLVLLFAAAAVFAPYGLKASAEKNGPLEISADAGSNLGKMPGLFRSGMISDFLDADNIGMELDSLKQKPDFRLYAGCVPLFDHLKKPENFEDEYKKYIKEVYVPSFKKFLDHGHKLIITLGIMPRWLSLFPYGELPDTDMPMWKWTVSPPKNYDDWEKVVQILVSTLKDNNIPADYLIHDEPDWMFYGTQEQYLELYKHGVHAIKGIDKNIKVGAPGTSNWGSTKNANCPGPDPNAVNGGGACPGTDHSMIKALIDYAGKNKLPIDFIEWHFPDIFSLKNEVRQTKSWLKEAGLPADTPLTIGEWVYNPAGEEESTQKASAYAVNLLKILGENGIARQTATSLMDQAGWTSGDWEHVGFFSAESNRLVGVIRPKWNAFKAIDKLIDGGKADQIKVSSTGNGFITALASQTEDKNTNRILISNFIPDGADMMKKYVFNELRSCLFSKRYSESGQKEILDAVKKSFKKIKGRGGLKITGLREKIKLAVEDAGMSSQTKNDLKSCLPRIQAEMDNIKYCSVNPGEVNVTVSGLSPGEYTASKYLIDEDHSNACGYNKKTEAYPSRAPCGINGEIDRRVALAKHEADAKGREAACGYLRSKGYTEKDINTLKTIIDSCANKRGGVKCAREQIDKNYNGPVKTDASEAFKTFKKTRGQVFYHDSANSIDKINSQKGAALEMVEQKAFSINERQGVGAPQNNQYQETIEVQPYSVLLIEIAKKK